MLRFSHELFTAEPVVAGIGRCRSNNKLLFKSARVLSNSVLLASIPSNTYVLQMIFKPACSPLKTSRDWEISLCWWMCACSCVGSRVCITVKCSVACSLFPAVLVIRIFFIFWRQVCWNSIWFGMHIGFHFVGMFCLYLFIYLLAGSKGSE